MTVLVGEQPKSYTLHKCFATKSSEFFVKATNGRWKEGKDKSVPLPDCMPEIFDIYLHWLYTGSIVLNITEDDEDRGTSEINELMHLYVLGNFLLDRPFRNVIVDRTLEVNRLYKKYPGSEAINIIWPETPADCQMQRLILRFWAIRRTPEKLAGSTEKTPQDFTSCLLKELGIIRDLGDSGREAQVPSFIRRCDYHEHDEGTPRCAF